MTISVNLTKKKAKRQVIKLDPWEDRIDYQTMVCYQKRGLEVGAYLLRKSPKSPLCLVFGFSSQGVHSFLPTDKLQPIFQQIEAGLKDLPQKERITFHLGAYKSDKQRQAHLDQLIENAPSDELRFLLMGEKGRIRQLSKEGLREPKSVNIFVTFHDHNRAKYQDWLDLVGMKLGEAWREFKGEKNLAVANLERFLWRAWGDGYIHWKQILENQLGLRVMPMSPQQMLDYQWRKYNESEPLPVPQQIIINENGITEEVNSSLHGATWLIESEEPVYNRKWVYVRGKYEAVLTFWEKPGGFANKLAQLHYLWKPIAKDLVTDTEIITQIVPANQHKTNKMASMVAKQSNRKAQVSVTRKERDVISEEKASEGMEAVRQMYSGGIPLYVAVVIKVRRRTVQELEEACSYLESCFRRPAYVRRERKIAFLWWEQAGLLKDVNLLTEGLIQRRLMYLNSEAMGFLPLVKTFSRDSEGLELIGEDGGTPVFIDLFNTGNDKHRHLLVCGTTRSGKSVLVGGILTQGLVRGIPIVAIDYPKPDGSSTYTTYTEFMEERGAYFDVGKESFNMFDRPNLSSLPPEKQQENTEDYKDFLVSSIQVMVVGESGDTLLNQVVRTVLYRTMNVFSQDPQILAKYEKAERGGFGSGEWGEMPTLKDFFDIFKKLVQEKAFDNGEQEKDFAHQGYSKLAQALELISVRLHYWAYESRVGRAISSPSSVPSNASLMVLALRQVSENEDAAILSLVAYAAALRRAMEHPISIFFIDESPILFKFPSVVRLVASIVSNGAKSGVRVVLSAQDPNAIFNSEAGQQILQNINTRIIGRIQPVAVDSFVEILKYDPLLIGKCTEFYPKKWGLYTNWMLDDSGVITFCRYYPAKTQLALVANNQDEQTLREEFLQSNPSKYHAIAAFGNALAESIQSGKELKAIASKYLTAASDGEVAA